ncbi:hypothetical protein VIGAN_05150200, partial [Vigna angularis var. angularis]
MNLVNPLFLHPRTKTDMFLALFFVHLPTMLYTKLGNDATNGHYLAYKINGTCYISSNQTCEWTLFPTFGTIFIKGSRIVINFIWYPRI